MTPHGHDPSATDDPDNGILEGAPSVETAGIDLLGTHTAHVNIAPPPEEEDDDDVVEGDIAFDGAVFEGGILAIDLPSAHPGGDDAVQDAEVEDAEVGDVEVEDAEVEDAEAEDVEPTRPRPEPTVSEDVASAGPAAWVESPAQSGSLHAPAAEAETSPVVDVDAEMDVAGEVIADAEMDADRTIDSDAARNIDAAGTIDAVDGEDFDEPTLARVDEKEIPMTDRTDSAPAPAEGRAVARSAPTPPSASVLVSRRIGELSDVAERETSDLLTADRLLGPAQVTRPEPEGVWQHLLYSITGGKVNIGDGKRARARKALDRRIAGALPGGGARFVAIVSRKGGVGKTTITTLLGQALADARDDRVIAVDANPDRGTLAERIARRSGRTVRDLVRERDNLRGYNDVSAIVARDETRLDVLASDTDPRIAEAFSGDEYRAVADVAAHYYSIVLTDTGTGIVHSVMGATLERADRLVVVAGRSIDEVRLASETLTWLEANGYEDQVRSAIVVLNMSSPGAPLVRLEEVEAHFRTRVRDVVRIPYDPQIATGGAIVFRDLQPATRAAARELAARVVEGLQSVAPAA